MIGRVARGIGRATTWPARKAAKAATTPARAYYRGSKGRGLVYQGLSEALGGRGIGYRARKAKGMKGVMARGGIRAGKHAARHPLMTAGTVGFAGYGANQVLPGAHQSRANQNDRVLRQIRRHQRDALSGMQPFVPSTGNIHPRSSGGYTI